MFFLSSVIGLGLRGAELLLTVRNASSAAAKPADKALPNPTKELLDLTKTFVLEAIKAGTRPLSGAQVNFFKLLLKAEDRDPNVWVEVSTQAGRVCAVPESQVTFHVSTILGEPHSTSTVRAGVEYRIVLRMVTSEVAKLLPAEESAGDGLDTGSGSGSMPSKPAA